MLAGIPTKESAALSIKNNILSDDKAIDKYNLDEVNQLIENLDLPNASNVNPYMQDSISIDEITSLINGKRPVDRPVPKNNYQPLQYQQTYQPNITEEEDYYGLNLIGKKVTQNGEKELNFDTKALLEKRLREKGKLPITEKVNPLSNSYIPSQTNIDPNQLKAMVEDMVYKVLAEIVGEANQNKINQETIKLKIGNSIFTGELTKVLKKPVKK
jgi:hypothetical protein